MVPGSTAIKTCRGGNASIKLHPKINCVGLTDLEQLSFKTCLLFTDAFPCLVRLIKLKRINQPKRREAGVRNSDFIILEFILQPGKTDLTWQQTSALFLDIHFQVSAVFNSAIDGAQRREKVR